MRRQKKRRDHGGADLPFPPDTFYIAGETAGADRSSIDDIDRRMRSAGDAAAGHRFRGFQRRGTDRSANSKRCGTGMRSDTHYSRETAFACTQCGLGHANNPVEPKGDSVCQSTLAKSTLVKLKTLVRLAAAGLLISRSSLRTRAKTFPAASGPRKSVGVSGMTIGTVF